MIDADDQSIHERLKQFHIALDPEKGELNQDTRLPNILTYSHSKLIPK
ncbi:MAG: hypothetical protein AAFY16_07360 [Cyanobacteria bacterium J06642_3]